MKTPYSSHFGSEGKFYVDGPGDGCGYYSGLLWPELRADTEEENEVRVKFANIGYVAGYEAAKKEIREALGLAQSEP